MKIVSNTARAKSKNKMHIPTTHITTMSMTQLRPTNILYGIQGDKFSVKYGQFTRLSPLVVPTYGSFTMKTFSFWIPLRTIWADYQNYMENTPDQTLAPTALNISETDIHRLFYTQQDSEGNLMYISEIGSSAPGSTPDNYDFMVYNSTSEMYYYYAFTERGRQLYNLLIGLGYEIPTYYNTSSEGAVKNLSLLPLLAYCRAMYDYIYPSAYVQQQGFGYLFTEQIFEYYNEGNIIDILFDAERLCFVPYQQSYWTSLWARPNSVAVGSQSSNFTATSAEAAGYRNILTSGEYNTGISQENASETMTLTSVGLRLLTAISDFTLRNNIGGTRFHEFMKSHFGYVTQEQDSTRSKFVKSWTDSVRIDDVTNMTDIGVLGEMAGKGTSASSGTLEFECKENGFLLFVSMIVPEIGYYQGLKPWCKSIDSREDLYLPEFDSLGMVGIPRKYIYNCPHSPEDVTKFGRPNDAFGYAQRYSTLKIGHDFLTGDFRLGTRNTDLDAYHTFRDVTYNRDDLALDAKFMHVDNQYQRIFSNMGEEISQGEYEQLDTFFTIFQFDVTKYTYMLSISEAMPFFDKSGESVTVNYEGNQL